MTDINLVKRSILSAAVIVFLIVACRQTSGYFSIIIALLACCWAMANARGKSLCCYAFFPFLVCLNSVILPKAGVLGYVCRGVPVLMAIIYLLVAQKNKGASRMPFSCLAPYLVFMVLSSTLGYCPKVSYLKLINFTVFWLGIWFGTQNLDKRPDDIRLLRAFFFGLTIVLVYGSIVSLAFPGISYALDHEVAVAMKEAGLSAAAEAYQYRNLNRVQLFCGITFQSQALGPLLVCAFAWVSGDMLFVSRKFNKFHLFLLIPMPILIFMTRSRTALFAFFVAGVMLLVFAGRYISLPFSIKAKIKRLINIVIVIAIVGGIGLELTNHTVTRWLRKTDDVAYDSRDMGQALTETRMGLIERTMREFRYNPLLGCGFQVDDTTDMNFGRGSGLLVLSAPVEKGLLPIMVLGEGGIVGAVLFWWFMVAFCLRCYKRKYILTLSLFVVFVATNIGEATFFSPGGVGGIEWVYALGGGFLLDSILIRFRQEEQLRWAYM